MSAEGIRGENNSASTASMISPHVSPEGGGEGDSGERGRCGVAGWRGVGL